MCIISYALARRTVPGALGRRQPVARLRQRLWPQMSPAMRSVHGPRRSLWPLITTKGYLLTSARVGEGHLGPVDGTRTIPDATPRSELGLGGRCKSLDLFPLGSVEQGSMVQRAAFAVPLMAVSAASTPATAAAAFAVMVPAAAARCAARATSLNSNASSSTLKSAGRGDRPKTARDGALGGRPVRRGDRAPG